MTTKTNDPRFFLPPADEITRIAKANIVAEWDFVTFDSGTPRLMLDQSGNGRNALFTANPIKTALGVTFNGTYWADATLPLMSGDYSTIIVYTNGATGNGYYVYGNKNLTDDNGFMLREGGIVNGINPNTTNYYGSGAAYNALMTKITDDNIARVKQIGGGILGYTSTLREDIPCTQTVWRLGGIRQTTSGNTNAPGPFPMDAGTIAYVMVWRGIGNERKDAAIGAYLRSRLTARPVIFAPA